MTIHNNTSLLPSELLQQASVQFDDYLKPWKAYGLTREQASKKAMDAISRELGSLEAAAHEDSNNAIERRMLLDGGDPAELWQTYRRLVQADTSIEEFGEKIYNLHPDKTPPVCRSKEKSKTPDFPA